MKALLVILDILNWIFVIGLAFLWGLFCSMTFTNIFVCLLLCIIGGGMIGMSISVFFTYIKFQITEKMDS